MLARLQGEITTPVYSNTVMATTVTLFFIIL